MARLPYTPNFDFQMKNMQIQLRKIRDFGESISDTIQFLKYNWKNLLMLYLIFVVPVLLIATLLGANSFSAIFSQLGDAQESSFRNFGDFFSIQLFLAVLLYLLSGTAYGTAVSLYMRVYEEKGGQTPSIQEIGRLLPSKLLSNLALIIILSMGAGVFMFIAIIPFLGILLFLTGVVYLGINLAILFQVNTIENNTIGGSISRCFSLMRNRWWYSFGYLIILFLIYYFFALIISFAVSTIFGFSAINFLDPGSVSKMTEKYFLVTGLSALVQQIFYLIIHTGLGIHYFSLKEEKEGSGLEERLDRLGMSGDAHTNIEEQY